MESSAGPSWTARPRTSSASTWKGRIASSPGAKRSVELAIRPIWSCRGEAPGEDAFLGVQPVLRLVEDDRLRAVNDLRLDLLAAMGRHAMHEDGVGFGGRHQPGRNPEGRQYVVTPGCLAVAHRHPGVGDH